MNTRIAATSALLLAATFATSAFAEGPLEASDPFASGKTRAEVMTELGSYKQSGVNPWSTSYNPLNKFKSSLSREQVVADYIASRDQVRAFGGEDSGSTYLAQMRATGAPATTLAGQPRPAQ